MFNLSPTRNLAEMSIFFDGLRIKPTCHSRSTMSSETMVTSVVELNIYKRVPIDGIAGIICDTKTF